RRCRRRRAPRRAARRPRKRLAGSSPGHCRRAGSEGLEHPARGRSRGYRYRVSHQHRVFVARLAGCAVFDPNGDRVGRVRDVVLVRRTGAAPRVIGLVVEVPGKRRVFLGIGRVTSIAAGQGITTGLINLRSFEQRSDGLRVVAELFGRRVLLIQDGAEAMIEVVAIGRDAVGDWEVVQLFVRKPRSGTLPLAKGPTAFVTWSETL